MSDDEIHGADHCFEEDDEERTLSTDTFLNEIDSQQLMEKPQETVQTEDLPTGGPKKPNPMILNLANKFDKLIEGPNLSVAELERPVVAKKKSPLHTSRIQKQISLYEKSDSVEESRPVQRQRSHRSVERMESTAFAIVKPQPTTPDVHGTTVIKLAPVPIKTKSCANLKNYYTATPPATPNAGALIVKENFIEPPKRVTKSFHGRTSDPIREDAGWRRGKGNAGESGLEGDLNVL